MFYYLVLDFEGSCGARGAGFLVASLFFSLFPEQRHLYIGCGWSSLGEGLPLRSRSQWSGILYIAFIPCGPLSSTAPPPQPVLQWKPQRAGVLVLLEAVPGSVATSNRTRSNSPPNAGLSSGDIRFSHAEQCLVSGAVIDLLVSSSSLWFSCLAQLLGYGISQGFLNINDVMSLALYGALKFEMITVMLSHYPQWSFIKHTLIG